MSDAPSQVRGTSSPMPVKDGRHHIHRLAHGINHLAPAALGRRSRIADHQRQVEGLVEIDFLAPDIMLAQHFGMVAGDDDQCAVILPGVLEIGR